MIYQVIILTRYYNTLQKITQIFQMKIKKIHFYYVNGETRLTLVETFTT